MTQITHPIPPRTYVRVAQFDYLCEIIGVNTTDGLYSVAYADFNRTRQLVQPCDIAEVYPNLPYKCGDAVSLIDSSYQFRISEIRDILPKTGQRKLSYWGYNRFYNVLTRLEPAEMYLICKPNLI